MHIGMTGTRNGMTEAQRATFYRLLTEESSVRGSRYIHHGDCLGADEESNHVAENLIMTTVVHPPVKGDLRAYCVGDETREEKGYLERNRDIVNESDLMFGMPPTMNDSGKGGTCYTIKYAKKKGKRPLLHDEEP